MDANVYPEPPNISAAHCASCGAPLHAGAASCGSCGLPTPIAAGASAPPPSATDLAMLSVDRQDTAITPTTESAPSADHEQIAQPLLPVGPVHRCNWCGAMNAEGADRCNSCNAVFPKPEQDDLLARASRERVRLAMEDFEEADRKRARSFFSRLFR